MLDTTIIHNYEKKKLEINVEGEQEKRYTVTNIYRERERESP